jgi:hypothetical protein
MIEKKIQQVHLKLERKAKAEAELNISKKLKRVLSHGQYPNIKFAHQTQSKHKKSDNSYEKQPEIRKTRQFWCPK